MKIKSQLPNENFRNNFDNIFKKKEKKHEFKKLDAPLNADSTLDLSECFDNDQAITDKYGSS